MSLVEIGRLQTEMERAMIETGLTLEDDNEQFTTISQPLEDLVETERHVVVDLHGFNQISTIEHIFAVTIIGLACFLGNGIVIHIYRQKQGYAGGKMYIILLATIDIFACCTLLPAFPLMTLDLMKPYLEIVFLTLGVIAIAYVWTLLTLTLERLLAIFKPFTIVENRRKLHKICIFLWSIHVTLQLISYMLRYFDISPLPRLPEYVNFVLIFGTNVTILASYVVMISKLISHSRSMVNYRAPDVTTSQRNKNDLEIRVPATPTSRYFQNH